MIYLKINRTGQNEIIALCDKNLIGKSFCEKDLTLNITERFYKGKLTDEKEILRILKDAKNINIVGKDAIKLALKSEIIDKSNIIKIKNIPHAIVFEI